MPIRETFWNIPHWAEIGQYLLGVLAVLVFAWGMVRRWRRWRQGTAEQRFDRLGSRLAGFVVHAVGQARTAKEPFAGIMHLTIFWGMAALFVGTALATIDWDVNRLCFRDAGFAGGERVSRGGAAHRGDETVLGRLVPGGECDRFSFPGDGRRHQPRPALSDLDRSCSGGFCCHCQ